MGVKDSRSYVAAYTAAVLCWMWCAFCLFGAVVELGFDSGRPSEPLARLPEAGRFLLVYVVNNKRT